MPDPIEILDVPDLPIAEDPTADMLAIITDPITSISYRAPYSKIGELLGVDALVSGVANAVQTTDPVNYPSINCFTVSGGAGTYNKFFSAGSTPIVFDTVADSMGSKEWQLRKNLTTGFWFKYELKTSSILKRFGDRSLGFQTEIYIDRVANTITMPTFYFVKKGAAFVKKTVTDYGGGSAFTFPIQVSTSVLDTLYFDATRLVAGTNPFVIESGAVLNTWDENKIIILHMIGGTVTAFFTVNDSAKGNVIYDKPAMIVKSPSGTATVNVNSASRAIEVTNPGAAQLFVVKGADYYAVPVGSQNNAAVTTQAAPNQVAGLNAIFYQISTGQFRLYNYTKLPEVKTADFVFCGSWFGGSSGEANLTSMQQVSQNAISVNGNFNFPPVAESLYNRMGVLISVNNSLKVYIDSTAKTIRTVVGNQDLSYCLLGADYYSLGAVADTTVSFDGGTSGIFFVYYDKTLKYVRAINYLSAATAKTSNFIFVGSFTFNNSSYTVRDNFNTLSKCFVIDGVAVNAPFAANGALTAPSKMWMFSDKPLTLYKDNLMRSDTERPNEFILANHAVSTTDFNFPTFQSFSSHVSLDASKLQPSFRIYSKRYADTFYDCAVDVAKQSVASTAKSGTTRVWNVIADSLGNRGLANSAKGYLASISSGLTLTTVGTMTNTGQSGEGREGWSFLNFVGADNLHSNGTVITRLADGATTSTLYQNPFLKLADATDKANHPTWCFRNTGANVEYNYGNDPTPTTGDFYIFDYAYYLSQHGITAPDIVTIALSTNDITLKGAAAISDCTMCIEIMLTQIKAAVPTVKVGIIPAYGQGDNSVVWPIFCDWIAALNLKLSALALSNIDVIGAWCHMNKHFNYPYSASTNLLSDGNTTVRYTKTEAIHFNADGYLELAKCLAPWLVFVS